MVIRWPAAAVRGYREPVLAPPADLPEAALVAALERGWGITVASIGYRPFGWGSHHWEVAGQRGSRWFVTADELETKRRAASDTLAAAFARLRASLATARALRDCGRSFVVAPVPAGDGEPLARLGDRFAVAVYPFIEGESFGWGEFASPEHRRGVLRMLVAVHTAPAEAARHGLADDFILQCRGNWRQPAAPRAGPPARGPTPGPWPHSSGGTPPSCWTCSPATTAWWRRRAPGPAGRSSHTASRIQPTRCWPATAGC